MIVLDNKITLEITERKTVKLSFEFPIDKAEIMAEIVRKVAEQMEKSELAGTE